MRRSKTLFKIQGLTFGIVLFFFQNASCILLTLIPVAYHDQCFVAVFIF